MRGARLNLDDGFTLALGGGGARGWAHIGVGMAAGHTPTEMEAAARRTSVYRLMRRRGRLALFDARELLERMAGQLGNPLIEELSLPLGVTTYDLVSGRPRLITSGPLVDALEMTIAVPLFLPPRRDATGVWCDAGPWEGIPVTLSRASARLAPRGSSERLTARRYLSLLTARWAEPVVTEPPDLLIAPRLGRMNALMFRRIDDALAIGERDTLAALDTIGAPEQVEVVHGG